MILGAFPTTAEIGVAAAATVAVLTVLRMVTGWSVTRLIVRKLVKEPVTEALEHVVDARLTPVLAEIRAELQYNGGTTVKDMVHAMAERQEVIEAGRQAELTDEGAP